MKFYIIMHSYRSTAPKLSLRLRRFTQLRREFVQSGPFPFFPRESYRGP